MRGIASTDPDLQTYEIFMPVNLIEHYKKTYLKEVNSNINEANS